MIPKKIHYCWFGGNEKSDTIKRCIASWKKYLPEYEILEWNEETFDLHSNLYVEQAYTARKWAFVSDYVRLYALYHHGGLYLDTDVEVLKPLDEFLDAPAFTGFETKDSPVTAILGAEKHNPVIRELLADYDHRRFLRDDGSFDLKTNTVAVTERFLAMGIRPNGRLQKLEQIHVYPAIYFCPNNFTRIWEKPSPRSYTIHHFEGSWKEGKSGSGRFVHNCKRYLMGRFRDMIGSGRVSALRRKLRNR